MTKLCVKISCSLLLFVCLSPSAGAEEIRLLPIPLLAAGFEPDDSEALLEIAGEVLAEEYDSGGVTLQFLEFTDEVPDGAEALPAQGGRGAETVFQPLIEAAGADGALAFWLQGEEANEVRLVAFLFLPQRIKLETFTVSVNQERKVVQVEDGKLDPQVFRDVFRALVQRNLDRIVAPPEQDPLETDSQPQNSVSEPPASQAPTAASPAAVGAPFSSTAVARAPRRLGVLPFSRNFRTDEKDLTQRYGSLVADVDLQELVAKVVPDGIEVERLRGPTLAFEQLEAPAITIDPNYDPSAKLQRLTRLCEKEGVDGLLIGHLREEDIDGELGLVTYLRLFLAEPAVIETVYRRLPRRWSEEALRREVSMTLEATYRSVGMKVPAGRTQLADVPQPLDVAPTKPGPITLGQRQGDLQYVVQSGDTLKNIGRKCYSGRPERIYPYLAIYNHLDNPDHLEPGQGLLIPERLWKFERRPGGCDAPD